MEDFHRLDSEQDLEDALGHERALLYKHSPWCGLSSMARIEVTWFSQGNPDVPVYVVDVISRRALARTIAERFDIEHESPQVILLERGRPVFDASHRGVSAHAIEAALSRQRSRQFPD